MPDAVSSWPFSRCLLIAEVAQAHDGSLGTAHAYIDAAASAGADAIKFQTHIAHEESTPAEPWRVKFSRQDTTRYEYWQRMEFSPAQWHELKAHADERGLLFLSSPFSVAAAELLCEVGVAAWKVASGEVATAPLFDAMARLPVPFLLSTGMSDWAEIETAANRVREKELPLCILQCTSKYPTPANEVGLNVLDEIGTRLGCVAGLSDHSGDIYAGLAAVARGAKAVEVHICWSKQSFGPDVPASLTIEQLGQLAEGIRFIEAAQTPVDKNAVARELQPMRALFNKSLVARRDLAEGTILQSEDIVLKKPGSGLAASRRDEFIGKMLQRNIAADTLLSESDFEVCQ
ncbi:MAG TPA: N-acetylneuraminate synthase family protein [Abditibacteriaceae bacterium]|jgi:N-acetylneuraminate synthase